MYNHKNYWDFGVKKRSGHKQAALHWSVEAGRQGKGRIAVINMDPQQTYVNWSTRALGRSVGLAPCPAYQACGVTKLLSIIPCDTFLGVTIRLGVERTCLDILI